MMSNNVLAPKKNAPRQCTKISILVLITASALAASDAAAEMVTYRWVGSIGVSISWNPNAAVTDPDPLGNGNATEYPAGSLVVEHGPFAATYGAAVGRGGNIRVVNDNPTVTGPNDQLLMEFDSVSSRSLNAAVEFTRNDGTVWNTQSLASASGQLLPLSQWDTAQLIFGQPLDDDFTVLDFASLELTEQLPNRITYQDVVPMIRGTFTFDRNAAVIDPNTFGNGNATTYAPGTLVVESGPFTGTYGAAVGENGGITVVDDNPNGPFTQDNFFVEFFSSEEVIMNFIRRDGAVWDTQSLPAVSEQLVPLDQWDAATIQFDAFDPTSREFLITEFVLVPEPSTGMLALVAAGWLCCCYRDRHASR